MAKIYSLLFLFSLAFFPSLVFAQNVGVGVANPLEKLDVDGAIRIKSTNGNLTGTIRYNPTTNKFEGRDNSSWKEFGSGSGTDDWTKVGDAPNATDADAVYHSGNVGIGTTIPLVKLHVKGLGATAIQAETSNSDDAIPAISAVNTIGIAIKATTSSATKSAIVAINTDSAGYALKVINNQGIGQEGGNAALFIGDISLEGALRNTDTTYGGSVAVNDGLTVGAIAGSSCTPVNDTLGWFVKDFGAAFQAIKKDLVYNPIFDNIMTFSPTRNCRKITNFYFEPYVGDEQAWPLDFEIFVRGQYIASVYEPSANLNQNPPLPSSYPTGPLVYFQNNGSLCGCWTSKWGFDSNIFNGEDPNSVSNNNWYVQFNSKTSDGEYLFGYKGRVDYKWANTISAPAYAAFGDIRASGTLYANSTHAYGDVAEFFKVIPSVRNPEPGDVVSISRKDPQTFELTTVQSDPLMAGVISENPSVLVNDPSQGDPIALTGRVKVKVNLNGGKIAPGDAITSSSVEGIGMKASMDGIILGYALESFDGSRTDVGKIWIFLARGHYEEVATISNVKEVDAPELGGMLTAGAIRVEGDEKIVFVPWDAKLVGKIPSDVEFADLLVELTPFGGAAKMVVKEVNEQGITVEILESTSSFQGFYYKADILTSKFASIPHEQTLEIANFADYDDRVAYATMLYSQWNNAFEELQRKGGMNFSPIQGMTSAKQINLYKKEVAKTWEKNVPELFEKWLSMGKELSQVINNDQSIVRKIKGM